MIRGKHFVRKDRTNLSFVSDFEKPHHGMKRVFNKINKKKSMGTRFGEVCQKNSQGKGRPLLFLMQSGADFD